MSAYDKVVDELMALAKELGSQMTDRRQFLLKEERRLNGLSQQRVAMQNWAKKHARVVKLKRHLGEL